MLSFFNWRRCATYCFPVAVLAASLSFPISAIACAPANRVAIPALTEFVVSGVLQKDASAVTIKLVHSLEVATSSEAALKAFSESVARAYPGYALATHLVTEVVPPHSNLPARRCGGVAI